jgi:hypothetical protein
LVQFRSAIDRPGLDEEQMPLQREATLVAERQSQHEVSDG